MAVVTSFKIFLTVSIVCLLIQLPAVAQRFFPQLPDEIEFYNGDIMKGKLKQIQRGELMFDPDMLEDIFTTKLRDVKYIRARRKEYVVETVENKKYYGVLEHGIAPGWVMIIQAGDTVNLNIKDLDNIENLDDNFWKRLDGNASLGFSYSRSSNIGRINGSHSINYSTRKWLFQANGDLMYTLDPEFKGVEKADWNLAAYIEFWKKWYAVSAFQFQRSTELGVDARFQLIQAAGPIIIKNRKNDLRAATGISAQKEFSTDTVHSGKRMSFEVPIVANYFLFKLGTPEIKLQSTSTFFFGVSEAGRWRADQNVVLYWKIITHLSMNLQLYLNFDSRPPTSTAEKVDYGTVFSIGYSW